MVFGLGSKQKNESADVKKAKDAGSKKKSAKDSRSDEAAEILKKMEAKKDSGDCAFC